MGTLLEVFEETEIDLTKENGIHLGTVYVRDPKKDFTYSMRERRIEKNLQQAILSGVVAESLCKRLILYGKFVISR